MLYELSQFFMFSQVNGTKGNWIGIELTGHKFCDQKICERRMTKIVTFNRHLPWAQHHE